jgi:hypothetical protein
MSDIDSTLPTYAWRTDPHPGFVEAVDESQVTRQNTGLLPWAVIEDRRSFNDRHRPT